MEKTKFKTLETIILLITTVTPFTIMSLPQTIINTLKSSTLLNITFITIICTIIAFIIYKLFKPFPGSDILDVSNFLGGSIFKTLISIIFISYFIITSAILLRNFCESLKVVYYQFTNVLYIILLFILVLTITNIFNFKSSLKTAQLIFPLTILSIILLLIGNINNFSFQRIYPILGTNLKNTFITGLTNIGSISSLSYLYLIPPLLKESKNFKKISIISTLFSGIFILICLSTLLFMFSLFINTNEIMPLFIASRYIEFGTFFQRFESIFLLIWIISFCCYLSINCKFSILLFTKTFNIKDSSQLTIPFSLLILLISLIPKNYAISNLFETYIFRYITIIIIILGIIILSLSNLKKKVRN